ncbi:MAG: translation initiation factor IF-3 [Candidatus Marinimicrobia bacterium]|nr:translation initiation factor IF-3 [Candidatus Neomarinimicrobiota bacterium]MCH8023593.1 translation initiation factor IF-3 [Candidatus Neomarinimicrobiota bacterium]
MTKGNLIPKINDQISAKEVRLVDADGNQVGVVSIEDAMSNAESAELDLVEVAPMANPPVAKIMDFGKYRFDQQKRMRENRKKQHTVSVKEVRMRPSIGDHDLDTKMNKAIEFLKDGCRLKISLRFRGREMSRQDLGLKLLNRVVEILEDYGAVEKSPSVEGRIMTMFLLPK